MIVLPSIRDPYSYLAERGTLSNDSPQKIQKKLGIPRAECCVGLEVQIAPEQVFIKVEQGKPAKFAIIKLRHKQVRRVIGDVKQVA